MAEKIADFVFRVHRKDRVLFLEGLGTGLAIAQALFVTGNIAAMLAVKFLEGDNLRIHDFAGGDHGSYLLSSCQLAS